MNLSRHVPILVALAALSLCCLGPCAMLFAQTNRPSSIMFDEYVGTLISARSNVLKIQTSDGEKHFRIVTGREDIPQLGVGRATAVSIQGVDRVSFLQTGMIVRLEASLDKNRKGISPVERVDVISLDARAPTNRERLSEEDPTTGVTVFRLTARIQSIDDDVKRLGLIARFANKSERYEVAVNSETTQVHYNLPDLSLAQEGENVLVRCPPVQSPTLIASEIRIERPSPFVDVAAAETPDEPQEPVEAEPAEQNPLAQMAETEIDKDPLAAEPATDEAEEDPQNMADANPDEPEEDRRDEENKDVVEFGFEPEDKFNPLIDPGVLRVVLGINFDDKRGPFERPVGPKKLERIWEPKKTPPGRTWFKIN